LPDNGNITDIRTERARSAIPIGFSILLSNLKIGIGLDVGYEDKIPSFGNLLLIELTNLY